MSRMNVALLACAAITLSTATSSFAEDHTVPVRYSDLDLQSDDGRLALDMRLKSAIDKVCGKNRTRSNEERRDINECRERMIAQVTIMRDDIIARSAPIDQAPVLTQADTRRVRPN